ncbi:MAG: family 78 glycoside hydrolase catalytic domain, partial [Anaerolineales bacterium]|nr:family 78 glycoside hydrolase catalytic domain [Anaerolineales bacterium]
RRTTGEPDEYTYYRKPFGLPAGAIQQATLYLSAVHQYELYLNGHCLGRGQAYHYPQYQYYRAYDVTDRLNAGEDNLLALLTHWYGGGQGRPASAPGLLLKLIVHYADGTPFVLGSDGSWQCARATAWQPDQPPRHPHEGVGYVERIDAREMLLDWYSNLGGYANWAGVTVLGAQPTPPWTGRLRPELTRIAEYPIAPQSIIDQGAGRYLVDLGAVYAGRPQLEFSGGTAGQEIQMAGGYTLDEHGAIHQPHNQGTDLRYIAIANGAPFTFRPQLYLGWRYLQIENSPCPITAENFSFIVQHSEMDAEQSAFASSDPMLNKVWAFLKRSVPLASQEQFLDTPTQEKGAFLLDSLNISLVALAAYGERLLTRRSLHEFLDSMDHYWHSAVDWGRLNAVYPNGDGARDIPEFTQSYLLWVWHYYQQTGDRNFLQAHYGKLKAIAAYVARHQSDSDGLIYHLTGGGGPYEEGIIDWPPSMRYGYDMATVARTVVNGYAAIDFTVIVQIATLLGDGAMAATYAARAARLTQGINSRLLTAAGIYCDGLRVDGSQSDHASQQANIFPLALGLTPAEQRASVLDHIRQMQMRVGMPTVYWLIRAVGEMGDGVHLLDLFTRADWTGWAQNIAQGATCTWESWDADRVKDVSMSHPWGAIGLLGIQEYVLGVQPLAPQYARLRVRPLWFGDRLPAASGTIPTERGPVALGWTRAGDHFSLELTLPPNVVAEVYLPAGPNQYHFAGEAGSGSHRFTLPAA